MENIFSISQKINGGFTERGNTTIFHANRIEVCLLDEGNSDILSD